MDVPPARQEWGCGVYFNLFASIRAVYKLPSLEAVNPRHSEEEDAQLPQKKPGTQPSTRSTGL